MEMIGIIGGDQRQVYICRFLRAQGWKTAAIFLPGSVREETEEQLWELWDECQYLLLPVPVFQNGILNLQTGHRIEEGQIVRHMKPGQCLFGGCFSKGFQKQLEERGVSAYDLMRCEHVITENAAVTAEGAIAEAVMRSPVALRGSVCILTGYGRCGSALHRCLKNWGCRLMVYDCEKDACERAKKEGAVVCSREMLAKEAEKAAFIFNTAPSLVWTDELLQRISPDACFLELASAPGGVDLEAAERQEVAIQKLPGLPGKTAPCTAGRILGEELLREIEKREKRK